MMSRGPRLLCYTAALVFISALNSFAQSGRGRQPGPPPPSPKPATKPNSVTVLGIPEGGKLVKQDLEGLTSRFVLRNGLTIIIRERHSLPLVSINVTVKAGPINESDEMAGMALLVKEMILRGSAKHPGPAIDREVARLGGILRSASSYDQTSFNITAPTESYTAAVELLADIITHPAFSADEIKSAAQMAILAGKRAQDDENRAVTDQLFAAAFTANRLKRGSAVSETLLSSVTREQALAFYQTFYHPANTVVTIIGDIFSIKALGQAQLNFGDYKKVTVAKAAGQDPYSPNPEEPAQDKLRYANTRADISQSLVTIGYRTPAVKADKEGLKELAAMQTLASVLGLGNGARLSQGLREGAASRDKTGVVIEADARFSPLPDAGMLIVELRVDPDRIDRAEAEYFREIERLRRELISEGELQRARVMIEKRYFDTVSLIELEADTLASYQSRFGDYRLFESSLGRIRALTPQDVQQAAAKYLSLTNATVHEYEPRNAQARTFTPDKFAELIITFAPGTAQPVKPEEIKQAIALKTFAQGADRNTVSEGQNVIVASVPMPIKDYSVLRGPRAYVREDKSQPKLTVSILFQGGRLTEDQTTSGTTELMLRSMLKSTTTRKAELIALELESYGGDLSIINEPDFFGYTLDVLSRNAENAIRLMIDIIENPFFDKEEVARERDRLIADQMQARDDETAHSVELLWESLYPGHPYGLPRMGLPEVIKAVTDDKLEAWHTRTIKRQFPLVMIIGDTDGSSLVSRIFSDGLKRGELDKTLKVSLPATVNSPQDKIEQRIKQLTYQSIGFRVMPQSINGLNDVYAADILQQIAVSNRLIDEIRRKQSLSEIVPVRFEQRVASGAFFAGVATLPENEQKARDALLAELQRMAAAPPSDDEFEQGRNAAIGRYAIVLQSHSQRALEYARAIILERKPSDVETQPDAIRAVKKTDIKRIAEIVIKANMAGRGVLRAVK